MSSSSTSTCSFHLCNRYSKHATLDPPLKITYDTLLSLGNKILSRGIPIRSTEGVFLAAYLTDELPVSGFI